MLEFSLNTLANNKIIISCYVIGFTKCTDVLRVYMLNDSHVASWFLPGREVGPTDFNA